MVAWKGTTTFQVPREGTGEGTQNGAEKGTLGGGGRRDEEERVLLSYRNGVARSQPFNELGQLTLYAQSFPAFRFYVNFNSLRRTVAEPRKSMPNESVRPRIHSEDRPSLSTTTE